MFSDFILVNIFKDLFFLFIIKKQLQRERERTERREREKQRNREIFHLVHSSYGNNSQGWVYSKKEPRTSCFPISVHTSKFFGCTQLLFQVCFLGARLKMEPLRLKPAGCQHCTQQINHSARPGKYF